MTLSGEGHRHQMEMDGKAESIFNQESEGGKDTRNPVNIGPSTAVAAVQLNRRPIVQTGGGEKGTKPLPSLGRDVFSSKVLLDPWTAGRDQEQMPP